jgi:hypothetical protein
MTFTELVTEVMARTRQTSDEAKTRIGRELNDRHRRITSSLGLATSRRGPVVSSATVVGNPEVSFSNVEKLFDVFLTGSARRVLSEITFDQWRNRNSWAPASGSPTSYAISHWTADKVFLALDPVPSAAGVTLEADALISLATLTDVAPNNVPVFAASFHDVLMYGALADEWMQLKQDDLMNKAEALYEQRLSELRYFIAKDAYLVIVQGGTGGLNRGAYWPGYTIPTWWR